MYRDTISFITCMLYAMPSNIELIAEGIVVLF